MKRQKIDVFNGGDMVRDFTYIDDIVDGVIRVLDKPANSNSGYDPLAPDPASSNVPYRVFNIGNGYPTPLMSFIKALEDALGVKAKMNMLPMQPGDVLATAADIELIKGWVEFQPNTNLQTGVFKFVEWYKNYYGYNSDVI